MKPSFRSVWLLEGTQASLGIVEGALSGLCQTRRYSLGAVPLKVASQVSGEQGEAPDVMVFACDEARRSDIAAFLKIVLSWGCASVLFADRLEQEALDDALAGGISAVIVDGLAPARVPVILLTALRRHQNIKLLSLERDQARTALAERKEIDRAKGIVMKQCRMSEEEAYATMRSAAMREKRKLVEIARSILIAARLEANPGGEGPRK